MMDNSAVTEISPWIRYPVAIVFIVFIVVIFGVAGARNRRRLKEFAKRHGLRYLANGGWDADVGADTMLAKLGPMGTEATVRMAAEGMIDNSGVSVFEVGYERDRSGPGGAAGYPVTAVKIWTERPLPHFTIRPEKLRHRFAALAGKEDIDVAECPAFSRRFLLQGDAPDAVREIFTPEICVLLEREPKLFAESVEYGLLLYHKPRMLRYSRFRDQDIKRLLALGLAWNHLLAARENHSA